MGETVSAFELMHFVEKCRSVKSACSPFFSEASPVCLLEVVQLAWTLAFPDFETFLYVRCSSNLPQKHGLLPYLFGDSALVSFGSFLVSSSSFFSATFCCNATLFFLPKTMPIFVQKAELFFKSTQYHTTVDNYSCCSTILTGPCIILRDAYIYIDKSYL